MQPMIERIMIVAGGTFGDRALEAIRSAGERDLLIGADRGALHIVRSGHTAAGAFGDFDSVSEVEMELIRESSGMLETFDAIDKDWTDMELAFRWALRQNPRQIVMLGATGTRLDHTLSNVFMLREALDAGVECVIADDHNEIRLIERSCTLRRCDRYTYVSLLSLSETTTGVTLQGFQYPLARATLRLGQSLGVSNVLVGDTGTITVESGLLLVIRSRD